ncbi:GTP cyclohydrolase II, partial [Modicella reniformis]
MSAHLLDHPTNTLQSYTTPPSTPPLTQLKKKQNQAKANNNNNKDSDKDQVKLTVVNIPSTTTTTTTATTSSPLAWCTARARIPTPDGSEYFLHIYENKQDKKEHLAFVFGETIRSKSLDEVQPNETEMDRFKRGAYQGRLRDLSTMDTLEATTTAAVTTTTVAMDQDVVMETAETMMKNKSTSSAAVEQSSATSLSSPPLLPEAPLVRIHSECFTGEIGHSARCDCGEQLDEAIRLMKEAGSGVVVYLRQEGRGIGLGEKL